MAKQSSSTGGLVRPKILTMTYQASCYCGRQDAKHITSDTCEEVGIRYSLPPRQGANISAMRKIKIYHVFSYCSTFQ